ncbi:MAG TPA: hypothetical protein DIU39_00275, partial [Flavobacteriales bacterium]|nr:hypothetical protein [Flavobacteriales bacterium]
MWQSKLQHNINQVPAQYRYWVAKGPLAYTEEHRQVIELSQKLWMSEISPYVGEKDKAIIVQNNLLQF